MFTSKRNPRRVSKAIYSFKFDFSSNPNAFLRSTHDPTKSPNTAPRSTHDLHQTATNAFGINTRSHDEPGMLWYHLLGAPGNNQLRNPKQLRKIHQKNTQKIRTNEQERKANTIFNEVRQFAYVLGAREREILLIQQSIQPIHCVQLKRALPLYL